jgi:hypothetical protein
MDFAERANIMRKYIRIIVNPRGAENGWHREIRV